MIAYVFWHVPRPGIGQRAYEAAHREFHEALWRAGPPGLSGVRVYRLPAIPWLGGRAGYEDWHDLTGSAALDALNDVAISQARKRPHDRIAALAESGTAGLYALRSGESCIASAAHWFSKPSGMSYPDFDAAMRPVLQAGVCLWGRRMTLGPAPEFCVQAGQALALPFEATRLACELMLAHGSG